MPSPISFSNEQRARDFLVQGRWRKARDEFKVLCKQDRATFLPLLIEANIGLARELTGKGQVAEAQQVLAYLRTIASPERLRAIEIEISRHAPGTNGGISPGLAEALTTELPDSERILLADQAVIAFQYLASDSPEKARLAGELEAIHGALQAVSEKRFDDAREMIRPVPQQSPFVHWKLFLKGLLAYYAGEMARAKKFFAGLPSGSIPAKASEGYALLFDGSGIAAPRRNVEAAATLAAAKTLGPILFQAEELWRKGQTLAAYKLLRNVVTDFPSAGTGLAGALTDLFFSCHHTLSFEVAETYADFFENLDRRNSWKNMAEAFFGTRLLAHFIEPEPDPELLNRFWGNFLKAHDRLRGPDRRLASRIWLHLGMELSRPSPAWSRSRQHPFADKAIEALQKAIDLDAMNLLAHQRLHDVFELSGRRAEARVAINRLLELFPDEVSVLITAASSYASDLKSFKAVELLRRAREIDRIDPLIPSRLVDQLFLKAHHEFSKKNPVAARATMDETLPDQVDSAKDFSRGKWACAVRRIALEELAGNATDQPEILGDASAAFFKCGYLRRLHAPDARLKAADRRFHALARQPDATKHATFVLEIADYFSRGMSLEYADGFAKLIEKIVSSAAGKIVTRQEAIDLIEAILARKLGSKEVLALVKRILNKDRSDPLFRLYYVLLRPDADQFKCTLELHRIIEEADRRGDHATRARAVEHLNRLDPPGADFDGEFEEDDGIFDPAFERKVAELVDEMSHASDSEIERMRRKIPKGIPPEFVEELFEAATRMRDERKQNHSSTRREKP
ncbi:MAG TPA: hypothetical protein VIT91_02745 [Chthoniobacterales bacterium]